MIFIWTVILLVSVLVLYIPVPWIIGRLLRKNQKQKAISKKWIFLTFDDGPGNRLTPQILKILSENDIKATFFLLGRNIAGRETIVHAIQDQKHTIASHSHSHSHAWKVAPWQALFDIKNGWDAINNVLSDNKKQVAYRPPCGKLNLLTFAYLMLKKIPIVFWTVDCLDTRPEDIRDLKCAAQRIQTDGGGIVLFHDFDRATASTDDYVLDSLKAVIDTAKKINLKFVTIESLFS